MTTNDDSEATSVLEALVNQLGILDLVQSLLDYDGTGGEGVSCDFDEEKPFMLVAENLGEEYERLFYLPGRRLAPLLEQWLVKEVRENVNLAKQTRSLAERYLPKIFLTFGCAGGSFGSDLHRCAQDLRHRASASQKIFSWTASAKPRPMTENEMRSGCVDYASSYARELSIDPIKRSFHFVFLRKLRELLPQLSEARPWIIHTHSFLPTLESGHLSHIVLRTELFGICTQVRVEPQDFCKHLYSHLCEVIAYYLVLADEAKESLDTTFAKLVEKMKNRGVW